MTIPDAGAWAQSLPAQGPRHVVVLGASGIVGYSATRHFAQLAGWKVTAVTRSTPVVLPGVRSLLLDLADREKCAQAIGELEDATHAVYAAYVERPGSQGWRDPGQMALNLSMLRNVMDPLIAAAPGFRHVTLLQGTKAYGPPMMAIPIPARERNPRAKHDVFYWQQEDYLREKQRGAIWHWSILRPQIVFGDALRSDISVVPAIGVYASLLKEAGQPLHFPGGSSWIGEAVDGRLLARACAWAAESPNCSNEIFNITNGDVFEWRSVWPTIAECFGMAVGRDEPMSLALELPSRQAEWRDIVHRYGLRAPADMMAFVGQGLDYADMHFRHGMETPSPARLVSTVKARLAGFTDCVDTEDMFRDCFRQWQERRLLPPP